MSDENNKIVPFGKYKGKSVEALLDDRPYLDWLLSQSWFFEHEVEAVVLPEIQA